MKLFSITFIIAGLLAFAIAKDNLNNCTDVVVDTLPDIDPDDGSIVITHKYSSKENGNQVWFYKVINGQHEWPPGWPEKSGNGDLNTSEEIWKFFQEDIENRGL